MARTTDPGTRPALLGAARELFYSDGIAATSLEDVASASGLTKPTLYRHFSSKDALVSAYLDDRHEQLDRELREWIDASPPSKRPRAVIDWLCDWLARPGFNGCAFVRSYAELQGDPSIRDMARRRKRSLLHAIEDACVAGEVKKPSVLAGQLALIVEGATTMAFITDDRQAAIRTARGLGELALKAAREKHG